MSKIYYSLTIILSLFILSSCGPGSTSSDSTSVYQVTITAEPEEAGSVSPSSAEVDNGDEIEISASPNANWMFDSWQGDHEGNTNPVVITVNSDKNITARFIERDYPLTVNVEGEGAVSERIIQPKTTDYPHGTMVELTANPSTGWIFSHWMGDAETEGNPVEIVVDEAKEVTAVFVPREFDLEIIIEGEGTVSEQVVDEENQTIQITASPADGWRFVEWLGDVTGTDNPIQIVMNEPKEVTAVFERDFFDLTVQIEEGGSVSDSLVSGTESDGEYEYESVVELTAIPDEGWSFIEWEGDLDGSDNPQTITMDSDKSVTAVFEEDEVVVELFTLTISTGGSGSGSVSPESGEYEEGATVELTATADEGSIFSHWEGEELDGSEDPEETITMDSDKSVTAIFEPEDDNGDDNGDDSDNGDISYFELSVESTSGGSVFVELQSGSISDGSYEEGSTVQLTAMSIAGWTFSNWEGDLSGTANPQTITMDSDKTVTAVFDEDPEIFSLTVSTDGSGTISPGSGDYEEGTEVELTATADPGWSFIGWEGDLSGLPIHRRLRWTRIKR